MPELDKLESVIKEENKLFKISVVKNDNKGQFVVSGGTAASYEGITKHFEEYLKLIKEDSIQYDFEDI